MRHLVVNLMDLITKINKSMVYIIGILISIISILLFLAVVLRYLFNAATGWAFDLAIWNTSILAFCLGGYALSTNQHVRVDLFYEKFSPKARSWVDLFGAILLLLMVAALIWLGMKYVVQHYHMGSVASGGLPIPLWIKWLIVPFGAALIGLQGIAKMINNISIVATGKPFDQRREEA